MLKSTRRTLLKTAATGFVGVGLASRSILAEEARIVKPIPVSGEMLPVIGVGTSRTFDVVDNPVLMARLQKVMDEFFFRGGGLIDSSPMYGAAERVTGTLLSRLGHTKGLFAATKVWTDGRQQGIDQMTRSFERMGVETMDLMQIHNLRDWKTHLKTLRKWKEVGKIRYIGITTSSGRGHSELAEIMQSEPLDFVQLSYNVINRRVEEKLLPIAQEKNIAVLANRPFQRGKLFSVVKNKPLPTWATDIDCQSWGQIFLKYTVSHPAITCAIPATSKLHHMIDNMGAGFGRLPNSVERRQIEALFD